MTRGSTAAPTAGVAAHDARTRRSWYCYDWAISVFTNSVTSLFFGPYLTDLTQSAADPAGFVRPLGIPIRGESFFPYVVGLATVLLLPALLVTGWAAQRIPRATLLGGLALVGSLATVGLALVPSGGYVAAAALFVLATVALASSVLVYNTWLPEISASGERADVSSRGSAAGYASGSIVLVLSLGVLALEEAGAFGTSAGGDVGVRINLALAGVWWLVFSAWPVRRLPNTPARSTAPGGAAGPGSSTDASGAWLSGGAELVRTLRTMGPTVPVFLLAFLFYNNGFEALSSQASTYGSEELRIDETGLTVAVLVVNVIAVGGALAAGRLARRWGDLRVLAAAVGYLAVVVVLAALAPVGSLLSFVVLAGLIGLAHGTVYAISRAVFTDLIAAGRAGPMFGLFELVNRSLTAFGTLAIGLVLQLGGGYRAALLSTVPFLVVGLVLLAPVAQRRARTNDGGRP